MSLLLLFQNRDLSGMAFPISSSTTLFIHGRDVSSDGNTTLFVDGHGAINDSITLYLDSQIPDSVRLYIEGHDQTTQDMTLFANGHLGINLDTTLFIEGILVADKSMNLSLISEIPPEIDNNIPLSIFGGNSGVDSLGKAINLYLDARGVPSTLNLFVQGPPSGTINKRLNLSIYGAGDIVTDSIDLVIWNVFTSKTNSITLFIPGEARQIDSTLNLFINRMPSESITLYMRGPADQENATIPLYVYGAYTYTDSIDLVLPNTIGVMTNSAKLYTHGF